MQHSLTSLEIAITGLNLRWTTPGLKEDLRTLSAKPLSVFDGRLWLISCRVSRERQDAGVSYCRPIFRTRMENDPPDIARKSGVSRFVAIDTSKWWRSAYLQTISCTIALMTEHEEEEWQKAIQVAKRHRDPSTTRSTPMMHKSRNERHNDALLCRIRLEGVTRCSL
jgi:hypothetical protein